MIDLQFERVSKKYRIRREVDGSAGQGRLARLGELRKRQRDFWALKDMSFQVSRGETLGIIGPNGAGKSTVLKLLSKITAPTSGEITIIGKLSALIEVGSGISPGANWSRERLFERLDPGDASTRDHRKAQQHH